MEAEFGRPQWSFGNPTYGYISADEIVCSYTQNGVWQLGIVDIATGELATYDLPYTDFNYVEVTPSTVVFLAGSPTEAGSIVAMDLDSMDLETLRWSSTVEVDPGYLSMPEAIEFPSRHGESAYAIYYAPRNQDFEAPAGEAPPLLVMSHGGPTGATSEQLQPEHPVLDQPRHRRGRCQLRRQHRLRARVSHAAQRHVGHRRHR